MVNLECIRTSRRNGTERCTDIHTEQIVIVSELLVDKRGPALMLVAHDPVYAILSAPIIPVHAYSGVFEMVRFVDYGGKTNQ